MLTRSVYTYVRHSIQDRRALVWIIGAQEILWLMMVLGVPLSFLSHGDVLSSPVIIFVEIPKIALLRTAAAAMAALWVMEWAIKGRLSDIQGFRVEAKPSSWGLGRPTMESLRNMSPRGWVISAAVLYFAVTLVTTLLSASVDVSLWGEVPGQDGYSAYTIAAYAVLFAAVSSHLKTSRQVWRLIAAIVTSGVLVSGYAICQHYGQDFLVLASPVQPERATSTMGNAIFVGSLLLMTILVTMTAATLANAGPFDRWRFWLLSGMWIALLTVQLSGVGFTFSRGPWVGLAFALAFFLALTGVFAGWKPLLRGGLMLSLAALFAWMVLLIPAPSRAGQPEQTGAGAASAAAERLTSISGQVTGGSFGARRDIWATSWRLMNRHPWVGFDPLGIPSLRPLVGYGPDLFRTAFLLESDPQGDMMLPGEAHQAHNYFLHAGVEMGYLGLAATLALYAAPWLSAGFILARRRHDQHPGLNILLAGFMALLAGRFLEQMVGLARVSDLTIFWAVLGLLAASPAVFAPAGEAEGDRLSMAQPQMDSDTSARTAGGAIGNPQWKVRSRTLIAAFCILMLALLTWDKSINYPRAALEIGKVDTLVSHGDLQAALAATDRAIRLAPDVFVYHNHRASILAGFRTRTAGPREIECQRRSENPGVTALPYQGCLSQEIYKSNVMAMSQRPLHYRSRASLGANTLALASLTGEPAVAASAIRLHLETLELMPRSWPLLNRLAVAYVQLGQPANALEALDRSLAITGGREESADARCIAGLAHRDLGELEQVAVSLERCLQLRETGASAREAHRVLASVYEGMGRQRLADQHRELSR